MLERRWPAPSENTTSLGYVSLKQPGSGIDHEQQMPRWLCRLWPSSVPRTSAWYREQTRDAKDILLSEKQSSMGTKRGLRSSCSAIYYPTLPDMYANGALHVESCETRQDQLLRACAPLLLACARGPYL